MARVHVVPHLLLGAWLLIPGAARAGPLRLLPNGGFESGHQAWTEFSSHGWDLIVSSDALPIPPAAGSWAAWLGGDSSEISELSQSVAVPSGYPILRFEHWVATEETDCLYDFAQILVDDVPIEEFGLCATTATTDWTLRSVDLGSVAGAEPVTIKVRVSTDTTLNSSLFVDELYCFSPSWIFDDGFESGGTCAWTVSVPPCG